MFITLFWSPVKSLLQLLFLASYLCSALQDTVEQTVIYSRNFSCKIHNCRRFPFTPCSEHSNFTCMVMVTVCVPQTWWADILYLPQLLSLPLCLSILFFALIFVGKYVQKKWQKNLLMHKVLWVTSVISHFIPTLVGKMWISRFAWFLVFSGYISRLRGELEWFLRVTKLFSSTEQLTAARAGQHRVKAASSDEDLYLVIMKFWTSKGWSKHNPLFKFI